MANEAREFIDFWIETSVHAREDSGIQGADQRVTELARRLIEAGIAQGISEKTIVSEVGSVTDYIRTKLNEANEAEKNRTR